MEIFDQPFLAEGGYGALKFDDIFLGIQVPGDKQRVAVAAAHGQRVVGVADERLGRAGEPHRQVGVQLLALQQGDGAALLLQTLDLQRQFAVEFIERLVGVRAGCFGQMSVRFVEHLRNARQREP